MACSSKKGKSVHRIQHQPKKPVLTGAIRWLNNGREKDISLLCNKRQRYCDWTFTPCSLQCTGAIWQGRGMMFRLLCSLLRCGYANYFTDKHELSKKCKIEYSVARAREQRFIIPITSEYKNFKWICLQQLRLECPHHLLVYWLLKLHSQTDKISFIGPCHLPKILGKTL